MRTYVALSLMEPLAQILSVAWLSPVEVIDVDSLLFSFSIVLWLRFRGRLRLLFPLRWLRLFWLRRLLKVHKLIIRLGFLLVPYT